MLPASNKGAGESFGFPDVCLTPSGPATVPIPYPNIAMNVMASPFCATILLTCMPALNMTSMIPMTLGDCPGVANPLFMQMGRYTMGCPTILLEAMPAINLTSQTSGNMMNNPVGCVLVPSATNVFFADASGHAGVVELGRSPAVDASASDAVVSRLLPNGIGYVAIRVFSAVVPSRVYAAVRRLEEEGIDFLVVDLRGNPGGETSAFVELAGDFLEPGAVIVTMVDADGDEITYRASQPNPYRMPVALLVDGATASAAELFAASLKAHGRATVVGETTYGKGVARSFAATPAGGRVCDAFASFVLPDGERVQGTGVRPHLPLSPQAREADGEPVCESLESAEQER
jgi:carboxyl-terminal processing protease